VVEPAVVNTHAGRENIVVGGEQRIKQAKKLGYKEFPCLEVSLPLEREKELNIRLNKNTGEWDIVLLEEHFQGEDLISWGFNPQELDFKEVGEKEIEGEDDIPEIAEKIRTKRGDLYELGPAGHRLYCGDSTIKDDVDRLFGPADSKFRLLFTSPPYNMKAALYAGYKDNRVNGDFVMFNFNVLMNYKRMIDREGFVFWNMSYNKHSGPSFLEVYYQFVKCSGLTFLEDICWDKGHGMPLNEQLTRQYEHLLVMNESLENIHFIDHVGVFGTKRLPFIKDQNKGISNYWRIDTFRSQSKEIKAAFPVELPRRAIELCAKPDDIVCDPFGGSGTTLIAAQISQRRAILMELDPQYCDLIVRRYTSFCHKNNTECPVSVNGKPIDWEHTD